MLVRSITAVCVCCLWIHVSDAWAQQASSIAGQVKDSSGGVLPGVTVEATSPALIEGTRSVITNGDGQYKIVDLRPGTYSVSYTMSGFTTVKRDSIVLTAGFTATADAELKVGSLEETLTVSALSSLVDTQNSSRQKVVTSEMLDVLPTAFKNLSNLVTLTPGMTSAADVGGGSGLLTSNSPRTNLYHGKPGAKTAFDGMQMNNYSSVIGNSYLLNPYAAEETTLELDGLSAESNSAGFAINFIPKEGGNDFKFVANGLFSNSGMQSDNLGADLVARGLTTSNQILHLYDSAFTVGGPIRKSKLWILGVARFAGNKNQVPGVFFNATQGTPVYTPDTSRPAYRQEDLRTAGARLTWQVSAKDKIGIFADNQYKYDVRGRGLFAAPEAGISYNYAPDGLYQASWKSIRSSRLLLDAGVSVCVCDYPFPSPGDGFMRVSPNDIAITELSTGLVYNASPYYFAVAKSRRYAERLSLTYVTGSHAFKVGVQDMQGRSEISPSYNQDVTYGFLKGVPNRITEYATPYTTTSRINAEMGLFAQDQWTVRRFTFNYGLRFDYVDGSVPEQDVPGGRFAPARSFAAVDNAPHWFDLDPRLGAAYDIFGDGSTALKASVGRYVGVATIELTNAVNPIITSVNSVNRTWTDSNLNFVPDCELTLTTQNGECGAVDVSNFGKPGIVTRYDPEVTSGYGKRDYIWDLAVELQRQLNSKISATVGYYRNWSNRFNGPSGSGLTAFSTDNLAVTPSDFSSYCVKAPSDSRLPGGGGYDICGLYDVNPAKFGQVNNVVRQSSHYGTPSRVSNFVGGSVNTRINDRTQLGGGVDAGQVATDNCFVVDSSQQLLNCHQVSPVKANTQVKLYGSYQLPWDFALAATFQNLSGANDLANYVAPNSVIAPSLGRNLAACGSQAVCTATATVPLVAPYTLFEPRRSQVDLRVTKAFRFGSARLKANIDIYNLTNSSAVLGANATYGPSWLLPVAPAVGSEAYVPGRLFQFSSQLTF